MHRLALVTLLAAGLAGCFDSPEEKLLGTWVLDIASFEELDEYKRMPEEQKELAMGMLESMHMEITFTKDTIRADMEVFGQKKSDSKAYEVKSADGNRLVLSAKDDNGKMRDVPVEIRGDVMFFDLGKGKVALKRK